MIADVNLARSDLIDLQKRRFEILDYCYFLALKKLRLKQRVISITCARNEGDFFNVIRYVKIFLFLLYLSFLNVLSSIVADHRLSLVIERTLILSRVDVL